MLRTYAVQALPRATAEGPTGLRTTASALGVCAASGLGFRLVHFADGQTILVPIPYSVHQTHVANRAWDRLVNLFQGSPLSELPPHDSYRWIIVTPSSLRSKDGIAVRSSLLDRLQTFGKAWLVECVPQALGATEASRGEWSLVAGIEGTSLRTQRTLQSSLLVNGESRRVGRAGELINTRSLMSPNTLVQHRPVLDSIEIADLLLSPPESGSELSDGQHYPAATQLPERLWSLKRPLDLSRHLLITGNPGTGKSHALFDLLTSEHPNVLNRSIVVIDPSKPTHELAPLLQRGYQLYEPGAEGPVNPFIAPLGRDTEYYEYLLNAIDQATSLSKMFPLGRSILNNALSALRHSEERPSAALLLREVVRSLSSMSGSAHVADAAISLRERLLDVLDAEGSGLLCGGSDAGIPWDLLLNNKTVITLAGFGSLAQRRLLSLCLLAGIVSSAKSNTDSQDLLIVLEEAHFFIQGGSVDEHPSTLVELLGDGLAELRSRRVGFVLAEQLPNLLPQTILSNAGNLVAFASRDKLQAERMADVLGGDSNFAHTLRTLPDHQAITRFGSEPKGILAKSMAKLEPKTSKYSIVTASSSFSLPWCSTCPKPCEAPASRQDADLVRTRSSFSRTNGDLLSVLREATYFLESKGMPQAAFEVSTHVTRGRLAAYCLASRASLEDVSGPHSDLIRQREVLNRWLATRTTNYEG